jgi:hypothetical protein
MMINLKHIKSEIDLVLVNPANNVYIKYKAIYILECLEKIPLATGKKSEVQRFKKIINECSNPFDFQKNIKNYSDLERIIDVLINIEQLIQE